MNKVKVTFLNPGSSDLTIWASEGDRLFDLIIKVGLSLDAPCSGNGTCGKCKVQIVEGEVDCPQDRHISDDEYKAGWRLACQSKLTGDVTVKIPETASAYRKGIKTADLSSKEEIKIFEEVKNKVEASGISFTNSFKVLTVEMNEPTIHDNLPDNIRLVKALEKLSGNKHVILPLNVLAKLPDTLRQNNFTVDVTVKEKRDQITVLNIGPVTETKKVYGLAVDIGTTTVSALIADLLTGEILAKGSCGNAQIKYGADVINRIINQTKEGGIETMRKCVLDDTINPLIFTMCSQLMIEEDDIVEACIAGNTTMEHFFLGINADYLRQEPFIPAFFGVKNIKASDVGIAISPYATVLMAPNVGSYVGGDITAGALASMVWAAEDVELFIDLGTNGELIVGNRDFMMCCACSAGPAFEGGDISCGMRATYGAVDSVKIDKETLEPELTIIDADKVNGLCGSGLIDIIGELFLTGALDGKGKLVRESDRILEDEYGIKRYVFAKKDMSLKDTDIAINEVDIDNFIRAKGALYSATKMLAEMIEIPMEFISKVQIAGGIGSGIDIENAVKIGMLPDIERDKYAYIGNSSLTGAYCMLLSDEARAKVDEIASNMTYVELSNEPKYMDEFIAACFLPHTDRSLFPSLVEVD